MSIRQMEYMLALASRKNLSLAADSCFISQSAMSQSLSKLELALGVRLFERRSNTWHPTEAGKRYLKYAARIVSLNNEMTRDLKRLTNEGHRTVRLGMTFERSLMLFPPVYSRFRETYPQGALQLGEGHYVGLQQMIIRGDLDLALSIVPSPDQIEEKRLLGFREEMTEELVLVVPPGHTLAKRYRRRGGEGVSAEEMAREKFILPGKKKVLRRIIDDVFRGLSVYPAEHLEVKNTSTVAELVGKGIGISIIPKMFARNASRLCVLPLEQPVFWKLGVLYRKGRKLSAAEKWLSACIREEFASLLESTER